MPDVHVLRRARSGLEPDQSGGIPEIKGDPVVKRTSLRWMVSSEILRSSKFKITRL